MLAAVILLPLASAPAYTVARWHPTTRCEEGDVNALFFYRGVWHLMHQFRNRPRTSIGHQVSTDLLHWARLPDALESGNATDEQCYDGGVSLVPHPSSGEIAPLLMIDGGCARKGKPGASCMESSGEDTGGVTAFPADLTDTNLTTWARIGPTKWDPCNASAWPSPIWYNDITRKYNLLAVHGFGEARFEAADASFTEWKLVDPAFITGIRGLGGGMWHRMPPNVDGVPGSPWATHIFQGAFGTAFNGLPNFVMGVYDPKAQTFSNTSHPVLLDTGGGVDYGQLSWTDAAQPRCLFVSWLRLTEKTPPDCGTQGQLTAIRELRYEPRLDTLVHYPIAEYYALRADQPLYESPSGGLALKAQAPPTTLYAGDDGVSLDAEFNISLPTAAGAVSTVVLGVRCANQALPCRDGATITLEMTAAPPPTPTDAHIGGATGGGRPNQPGAARTVTMHIDYTYHITQSIPVLAGESHVTLRVLSDTRSLEIFAGGGRSAASLTMLSTDGIVLAGVKAGPDVSVDVAGWAMSL